MKHYSGGTCPSVCTEFFCNINNEHYSKLDVAPISQMLEWSFSLVIEFLIEFHCSDYSLSNLSILIWKAAWACGQDNGSEVIARKYFTTDLFSSNKLFPVVTRHAVNRIWVLTCMYINISVEIVKD